VKANCWIGRNKVEIRDVPDPGMLNRRDAIVRITSTAICGSDLHLLDGYVPPTMQEGDVLGHEFMGEIVEVGDRVDPERLRVGDRVVVPFPIACGACAACAAELYSCCENSNPNAGIAEKMFGHPVGGIFGYSHLTGGFAGGRRSTQGFPSPTSGP
jgi:threonine dehydrogenase-like Zn-dependent dehydrogenase